MSETQSFTSPSESSNVLSDPPGPSAATSVRTSSAVVGSIPALCMKVNANSSTDQFQAHHPNPDPVIAWFRHTVDQLREALHRTFGDSTHRLAERRQEIREASRAFYQSTRDQFLRHPTVDRLRREIQRHADNVYRKALPVLTEIARNNFLTGAAAFFLGLLVARLFLPSPKYVCPTKPHRMKAITCDANRLFGLESLSISVDVERPRINLPDQVLVRVLAASIDPVDILMLSGFAQNERRSSLTQSSIILGRDFSGLIVEVGVNVTNFNVGDAVWSAVPLAANGSLCEYIVLPASQVALKPKQLSFESCSTLPYSSIITWQSLVNEAKLGPNNTDLICALVVDGTSSTGCIAIQLLKAWGAQVTTCVPYRVSPLAHMLGAQTIIAITPADVDAEEKCRHTLVNAPKFDIILLTREVGLLSESFCRRYLKSNGKLIKTFPERLPSDGYDYFRQLLLSWIRRFFYAPYHTLDIQPLKYIQELIQQGQLQPVLDSSSPAEEFEAAFQATAAGANVGKAVITFGARKQY